MKKVNILLSLLLFIIIQTTIGQSVNKSKGFSIPIDKKGIKIIFYNTEALNCLNRELRSIQQHPADSIFVSVDNRATNIYPTAFVFATRNNEKELYCFLFNTYQRNYYKIKLKVDSVGTFNVLNIYNMLIADSSSLNYNITNVVDVPDWYIYVKFGRIDKHVITNGSHLNKDFGFMDESMVDLMQYYLFANWKTEGKSKSHGIVKEFSLIKYNKNSNSIVPKRISHKRS